MIYIESMYLLVTCTHTFFLAELTKFGLCPKAETMKCITVSVFMETVKNSDVHVHNNNIIIHVHCIAACTFNSDIIL